MDGPRHTSRVLEYAWATLGCSSVGQYACMHANTHVQIHTNTINGSVLMCVVKQDLRENTLKKDLLCSALSVHKNTCCHLELFLNLKIKSVKIRVLLYWLSKKCLLFRSVLHLIRSVTESYFLFIAVFIIIIISDLLFNYNSFNSLSRRLRVLNI